MNPLPDQNATAADGQPTDPIPETPPRKSGKAFAKPMQIVLAVLVGLAVLGVALPYFNSVTVKCGQSRELAHAKMIGLALKLYAGDHDGVYPAGTNSYGQPIRTSNDAFRSLFPTYTQSETIFGNKLSAWQTSPPDNVITPVSEILKPGENVYAYVEGLTDASRPDCPLIAEGTDGTGHYVADPKARGGLRQGTHAVVIRLDNSGALESGTMHGPGNARYIARPEDSTQNLLDVSAYLGPQVRLLDPAAKN